MKPQTFLHKQPILSPQEQLSALVEVLTGPQGCPWDQRQTAESIIDFVIDEAHELKSSLNRGDLSDITAETGDLLFTVEFLCHGLRTRVSRSQAAAAVIQKMIARHPHVFADKEFVDEHQLKQNWEAEKLRENASRKRYDEDIPTSLPSLKKAGKILTRLSNSGFRYGSKQEAWYKVCEEHQELEHAVLADDSNGFEEELGDLLLSLLTLAKMNDCSVERSLEKSLTKVCDRIESLEREAGKPLSQIPHGDLKALYTAAKSSPPIKSAYFNYSGVGLWSQEVLEAVRKTSLEFSRNGLKAALDKREEREQFRPTLLRFCSAPKDSQLVYVSNISTAAYGVAQAQNWTKGDSILLGKYEFPANTAPWCSVAQGTQTNILWFDDDLLRRDPSRGWSELESLIQTHRPRLMAISAVSFWSGFRVDLKRLGKLCATHDTRLFVDAIQALGTVPVVLESGISYLAGGSHKGLRAPEAAGFLVVSSDACLDWIPRVTSWLGLENPVDFLSNGKTEAIPNPPKPRQGDPSTLEGSSPNSLGYAGLLASVNELMNQDLDALFQHIMSQQDRLEETMLRHGWQSLRAQNLSNRSAILSFCAPPHVDLVGLQQRLSELGVFVGIPNGHLRFGLHGATRDREVDYAITQLKACLVKP